MEFMHLLKGLIVGFILPIPIGPVGILCIRRTMAYGRIHGFLTGLSAAISDMTYSAVAAFGITFVSNFIAGHQEAIHLFGGVVLLAVGLHTFRPRLINEAVAKKVTAPVITFISTFLVTFTNPMAVVGYAVVFAGIGVNDLVHNRIAAALLVAGVFLGSLAWFTLLTFLSRALRVKITGRGLDLVNKVAGTFLMLFGVVALWSGLSRM